MSKSMIRILFVITLITMLTGCDALENLGIGGGKAPAEDMLPDFSGYQTVEGEVLTDYIGTLSGGAVLLVGHPEIAAAIGAVDYIVGCYQEVGAAKARIYSSEENPLEAGAIAIADRNALLNPVNLFKCVTPALDASSAQPLEIEPCTASYTLEKDDNEFYIIYAGTTEDICKMFCANLEGCTEHK